MFKLSKDESLGERETCRRGRRHRLCSCVAFLGRPHQGLGGVLMSATGVTVRSFHLVRVIIDLGSGVDFRSG